MEIEESGYPINKMKEMPKKVTSVDFSRVFEDIFSGKIKPKLHKDDYAYFLIERLEEDLQDAFADPLIWEECIMSAKDRLNSLKKHLKGDI